MNWNQLANRTLNFANCTGLFANGHSSRMGRNIYNSNDTYSDRTHIQTERIFKGSHRYIDRTHIQRGHIFKRIHIQNGYIIEKLAYLDCIRIRYSFYTHILFASPHYPSLAARASFCEAPANLASPLILLCVSTSSASRSFSRRFREACTRRAPNLRSA